MKSFPESRLSLDIPPINASLKHNFILMSHVKKQLVALAVLFSLEFLSLGLFTHGTFSWTDQYVPPLLKAASHTDASAVKLDSPAKTDGGFVLETYGELTPRSGGLLTAKGNAEVFLQRFSVVPLSFRIILAPKVSRYLSKSVLIL
jgi:hypothetical protein